MGGANYSAILANHSYIDVFNFSSPKLLADYLFRVGSDKNLYNSYFEWKTKYCVEQYFPNRNMCQLCKRLNLNEKDEKRPNLEERAKWWQNEAKCRRIKYIDENISFV